MQQESHKKRKKQASGLTLKQEEKMETVLTKALGVNVKFKKPSKMLEAALNALSLDFGKLQTKVNKVFEIGRKEHYSDMDIGGMVREKMKEEYSDRTIQRLLPETAKQLSKGHDNTKGKKFDDKMSSNEHETSKQEQEIPQGDTSDKYKVYQDTIVAKSKLIKELQEENAGLRKKIAELEAEVKRLKK